MYSQDGSDKTKERDLPVGKVAEDGKVDGKHRPHVQLNTHQRMNDRLVKVAHTVTAIVNAIQGMPGWQSHANMNIAVGRKSPATQHMYNRASTNLWATFLLCFRISTECGFRLGWNHTY